MHKEKKTTLMSCPYDSVYIYFLFWIVKVLELEML